MSRPLPLLSDLGPAPAGAPDDLFATGSAVVDARLGGGLARAALHEIYAAEPADHGVAAAFALLLTLRGNTAKPLIWLREDQGERLGGRLYAPGLRELGADVDAMVLVTAADTLALLRAGADAVACDAVGAVILEPWGRAAVLDLTASRRLALAATRSGVVTLVVRSGVDPVPSAARTRWRVGTAPSRALPANAPGQTAFDISLLRHRGGIAGFAARVEWDRDRSIFRDPPLSRGVPAPAAGRADGEGVRHAA